MSDQQSARTSDILKVSLEAQERAKEWAAVEFNGWVNERFIEDLVPYRDAVLNKS